MAFSSKLGAEANLKVGMLPHLLPDEGILHGPRNVALIIYDGIKVWAKDPHCADIFTSDLWLLLS